MTDRKVSLQEVLEIVDAKINLAEYDSLYTLEALKRKLIRQFANVPSLQELIEKCEHASTDCEHGLDAPVYFVLADAEASKDRELSIKTFIADGESTVITLQKV